MQAHARPINLHVALGVVSAVAVALLSACTGNGEADPVYPVIPTDELVATGRPVYETRCASCHGDASTRPPLPSAPSHGDDGHTWHHPDRLLVEWVLDGVPLATQMPRFRDQLTEPEVRAVLAYVKTFWSEDVRQFQREGSEQYEAQIAEHPR